MSFTQRAAHMAPSAIGSVPENCDPGSRADFLQALALLCVPWPQRRVCFEVGPIEIALVRVAYLRCTIELWHDVFGVPENVEMHAETVPMFPVEVWTYQCVDGPVACIGHQVDDLYGRRWVTFVRLCDF